MQSNQRYEDNASKQIVDSCPAKRYKLSGMLVIDFIWPLTKGGRVVNTTVTRGK